MTYFLYNTDSGTFTGETWTVKIPEAFAQVAAENQMHRSVGAPIRWVPASCDSCDSHNDVHLYDGRALCRHCNHIA